MAVPLPVSERVRRKVPRLLKFARQWIRCGGVASRVPTRAIFVLGAQRSGTRLPLHVLEQCPEIITNSEGTSRYFDGVLLKSDRTVRQRLEREPFPIVVLKPICESHRGPELLATFPGARIVWIFRNYCDTARSSALKWQRGVEHIANLATGNLAAAGWRAGGLTKDKLQTIARVYSPDMSKQSAYALQWWIRTSLYFDVGLADRSDVLLVRYEDLVSDPKIHFPRVFDFVGRPLKASYLAGIYASSVVARPLDGVPQPILQLCEDLSDKLEAHYRATLSASASDPVLPRT